MSSEKDAEPEEKEPAKGPNLVLLYSLLALALVVSMGIAALIILPFYQHRH
ncbi:MAG: hypothetical protein WCC26_10625 [Terracidiphilus sp.]